MIPNRQALGPDATTEGGKALQDRKDSDSRKLLRRLKEILAAAGDGQDRLDQITHNIADSMGTDVCSIYLFRDPETLELCATEGLRAEAVHQTRLRLGEGLVGRVARTGRYMNTADAPASAARAIPKSMTLTSCAVCSTGGPSGHRGTRIFDGLMSRWMTPAP